MTPSTPPATSAADPVSRFGGVRPEGAKEFTLRAVLCGVGVAAVIGASYPYVVMKLGFGPNISVVSAFFGYLALGLVFKDFTRWENNIVQTAGTAAGQTSFMCVLMAAFDMLRMRPALHFTLTLSPLQSFAWLVSAGLLGVFLAVPMRQHFVVDEQLPFADGVAAAETLVVLDSRGPEAQKAARAMGVGTVLSAVVMLLRADAKVFKPGGRLGSLALWSRLPFQEMWAFGSQSFQTMAVGLSWSLLSLGSGMLVGARITSSMLLGALLSWVVAPKLLLSSGVIHDFTRREVLLWVMWPATGMLVSSGLTALVLRWRLLVKTFKNLSGPAASEGEFPMKFVIAGTLASAVALIIVQKVSLGMPLWMTVVAMLLSIPLMLVSLRVLGETNWGPISAMSNMMQGIFGLLAPGHIAANMAASGTTGTIAAESEGLMQDYKTGYLIGSSPRHLTYAQLIATPVGEAAVSLMYPLLRDKYGIGESGLSSPISVKWAGFAELLSQGLSAIAPSAVWALGLATALGVVFTLLEQRWKRFVPSPTGVGIGMLVPASAIFTMFAGGMLQLAWRARSPKSADAYVIPLASGFIAGEAIVAVVLPVLVALGLMAL